MRYLPEPKINSSLSLDVSELMFAGKKTKKVEKEGTQAQKNKQVRLHTSTHRLPAS